MQNVLKINRPELERISPDLGSSIALKRHDEPSEGNVRYWHFHPEIEMAYIREGNGKRHIGSHLSYFRRGDFILIGSNLPHSGFSNRLSGSQDEVVLQMLPDFLGPDFFDLPEMADIKQLFVRAKLGISFYGKTKRECGDQLTQLLDLQPFDRLMQMIQLLQTLALSKEYKLLNAVPMSIETRAQDRDRIKNIFQFVQEHFSRPISLAEIAAEVNLTEPSFSRFFKDSTGKTFTRFVNEHRIVQASKLLAEGSLSISEICYESGFNNYSHFTKKFKLLTGKTPRQYRDEVTHLVG